MALSIFQIPRKPSLADSQPDTGWFTQTDRLRRIGGRLLTREDKQAIDLTSESFIDPVHGRHCICARCDRQRAA